MSKFLKQEKAIKVIRKFPKHGSLTLARILYKENTKLFKNLEQARHHIRYYRGENGNKNRSRAAKHGLFGTKPKQDPFMQFPEGIRQIDDWKAVQIDCRRALIISDLHIPFHDKAAIIIAIKHGQQYGADTILINGDWMDFYSLSHWQTDPNMRDLANELETGRQGLAMLRQSFSKARIIFKKGNHDEWLERYYMTKAPELLGVPDFELSKLLRFDDFGIESIADKRPVRIGALNIVHGHEFAKTAFGAPVNAARGLYLRAKTTALCGHWHATAEHTERDIEESTKTCWAAGALCDLHPQYAVMNKWNLGFATVELEKDGKNFTLENKKILNGKVY